MTGSSLLSSKRSMEEESPSKSVASRAIVERRFCASKLAGPEPSWYLEGELLHIASLNFEHLPYSRGKPKAEEKRGKCLAGSL